MDEAQCDERDRCGVKIVLQSTHQYQLVGAVVQKHDFPAWCGSIRASSSTRSKATSVVALSRNVFTPILVSNRWTII